MDRRRFLAGVSVAGVSTAIGLAGWQQLSGRDGSTGTLGSGTTPTTGAPTTTTPASPVPESGGPESPSGDRILVVVQMNGGNDALNTLVPSDGRYRDFRSTIAIPEDELLVLGGVSDHFLHPALEPLLPYWDDGTMAAVAGVGFEGAGRSHFEAMDWWFRGSPDPSVTTGWLGRWLDLTDDGTDSPFRSVALGGGAPALKGEISVPTVVTSPAAFSFRAPRGSDPDALEAARAALVDPISADPWIATAQLAQQRTAEAVELFASLASGETDRETDRVRRGSSVADSLATAAALIREDLGTRVILVSTSGFDTHSNQPDTQASLLGDVATGVAGFLESLRSTEWADRVMVMTTSEFGRRVQENGSGGTDHGRAGVHFLAGSGIEGGLVGGWDLGSLTDGDLTPVIDVRAMYRSALTWLGGPVEEVLGGTFEDLGVLSPSLV